MVKAATKRPAGSKRKHSSAGTGRAHRNAGGAGKRKVALSHSDIAELAGKMHVPEGILHIVLSRYPELARPLARHRALLAEHRGKIASP
jgi:hypothetical protein